MGVFRFKKRHLPLYGMFGVFVIPVLIAALLQLFHYSGDLQNKGTWIKQPVAIDEIILKTPHAGYSWLVIIPCHTTCNQITVTQVEHGISTLGKKANLVQVLPIQQEMIYQHHRNTLKVGEIYLATPQKELMLSYPESKIMDLVSDLKRLVKPIERRS